MVIHLRGPGVSVRKTFLHCKDYVVAVAKKEWTQNIKGFLHYFYQLDIVLT